MFNGIKMTIFFIFENYFGKKLNLFDRNVSNGRFPPPVGGHEVFKRQSLITI